MIFGYEKGAGKGHCTPSAWKVVYRLIFFIFPEPVSYVEGCRLGLCPQIGDAHTSRIGVFWKFGIHNSIAMCKPTGTTAPSGPPPSALSPLAALETFLRRLLELCAGVAGNFTPAAWGPTPTPRPTQPAHSTPGGGSPARPGFARSTRRGPRRGWQCGRTACRPRRRRNGWRRRGRTCGTTTGSASRWRSGMPPATGGSRCPRTTTPRSAGPHPPHLSVGPRGIAPFVSVASWWGTYL